MIASTGGNSKRIALLAETGGAGGAERMMVHLGDELLRRGHEVIPVLPNGRNPWMVDQFSNRGCTPEMFTATPGSSDLKALAQMVGILRRRRVDVVHTHEFFTSVYGGAAARLLRKPQVITMHGGRYYASSKHRKTALRWVARGSRAVVGVSDATATELAEQLGIARARVQVVHNGVRPEAGHREPVRRELGVGDEETLVVAVGNLYPVKAHIVLLRALAGMRNSGDTRWRLAIAGRGGEEAALRAFVAESGLTDRVHILGYRADIANILAAGDVYAMPSLSEGLPMALIEAMLAARPVIASRTGGIPEVVTDGVHGLLVTPGDAESLAAGLGRLFADSALRTQLAAAGRQKAIDCFSVERMVDAYERLYGVAQQDHR
jgi:glycosyltransferase involved in cell wall biosynthesis